MKMAVEQSNPFNVPKGAHCRKGRRFSAGGPISTDNRCLRRRTQFSGDQGDVALAFSLASGHTPEPILADSPRLATEDIQAVIAFVAASARTGLALCQTFREFNQKFIPFRH